MEESPMIALKEGSVILNYKVIKEIGRGGFGIVYLVEKEF
jgi:serine/threonine protein kinase